MPCGAVVRICPCHQTQRFSGGSTALFYFFARHRKAAAKAPNRDRPRAVSIRRIDVAAVFAVASQKLVPDRQSVLSTLGQLVLVNRRWNRPGGEFWRARHARKTSLVLRREQLGDSWPATANLFFRPRRQSTTIRRRVDADLDRLFAVGLQR